MVQLRESLRRRHRREDERGAVAVFVSIFMSTVLFAIAALVVDLGLGRDTAQASQITADASALAAANVLYPESMTCSAGATPPCYADAVTAAIDYAEANFGVDDWSTCPAPPAGFTSFPYSPPGDAKAALGYRCVSFDSLTAPTKVWMYVPTRTVDMPFGSAATDNQVSKLDIQTRAQASLEPGSMKYSGCGICVLDQNFKSADDTGGAKLLANNTNVYLNGITNWSGSAHATVTNGTLTLQYPPNTSGGAGLSPYTIDPTGVEDPLAFLTQPAVPPSSLPDLSASDFRGTCNLQPGRYDDITVPSGVTCTFAPGIYIITGTLGLSGSAAVDATSGVTMYFTCGTAASPEECAPGEAGGYLTMSGGSSFAIHGPTSGPTQGLALFYDRNNTSPLALSGGSANRVTGTIYAASSLAVMTGGSSTASMDTMIVVKRLNLTGSGTVSVNYTAENNVIIPTAPGSIYLSQ